MTPNSLGVLVAGMHRSGTSASTGALQHMGVSLGDGLMDGGEDNPLGYFEPEAVVLVHDELMRELGSWWSDPRPLPSGWLDVPPTRRAEEQLVKLIRRNYAQASVWAMKDPRVCRLLPLWRRCLERLDLGACVLHVVRPPSEVAASLRSRDGFSRSLGELLWLRHVTTAIRDSRGLPRTVLLYHSLLSDPSGVMRRALASLDLELGNPASVGDSALSAFVDPGFCHHDKSAPIQGNRVSELAAEIYQVYVDVAAGSDRWRELHVLCDQFDADWAAMEPLLGSVAESVFPAMDGKTVLHSELMLVRSQLNAQIAWSEQAVVDHAAVSQAHQLLVDRSHGLQMQLMEAEAKCLRHQSDLAGQVRWAESYVLVHEAVRDERDRLSRAREQLEAQLVEANQSLALVQAERARQQFELQQAETAAEKARHEASLQLQAAESLGHQILAEKERHDRLEQDNLELAAARDAAWAQVATLRAEVAARDDESNKVRAELDQLKLDYERVLSSASWRWTSPLRAISRFGAGVRPATPIMNSKKEKGQ